MPRAGFGGSGDYSSFFGSIYSAGKAEADAQQDASDQDAFDKWQNGLMSDQEWIQYIEGRVDAYAGDPKKQEKWVGYLRQYSAVIADNQAEFAYKNGDSSVNQLIAHYQDRLAHMDGGSTEARDMQLRINDLMDQRAQNDIQDGAQKLVDDINKGKATYQDLQKFLKDHLSDTRPNSDLRESLKNQIKQTSETIRSNQLEGRFEQLQYQYDKGSLGAGAYANHLTRMAQQFKKTDPKRYYQILEAAVALRKSGGSGGSGGGGGGSSSGSSGGSGGSSGGHGKIDWYKRADSAMADRDSALAMIGQYEDGAKVGVDPLTGKQIVFNESVIRDLDHKVMGAIDRLANAYFHRGDKSAARGALKSKANYLSYNVVKHNTMPAQEAENQLLQVTQKQINDALDDPDPTRGMNKLRDIAKQWKTFASGISSQNPGERVDTEFSGNADKMAKYLDTLTNPNVTDEEAAAVLADTDFPAGDLLKAVAQVHGNEQGLASGEVTRVIKGDRIEYVRTSPVTSMQLMPDGSAQPVKVRVPDVDVDGDRTKLVDVFIDINGKPTKVQAVATKSTVQGLNSWFAKSKIKMPDGSVIPAGWVSADTIEKLGADTVRQLAGSQKLSLEPSVTYYQANVPGGTDANGQQRPAETWVQDAETGLWYKDKLPIRGAQRDEYGAVKVTDSGLAIDYKSFSSASGAPAPYVGTNAKGMQALMDNGQVDVSDIRGRDVLGNVTDKANLTSPYWNGQANRTADPSHRDSWWNEDERDQRAVEARFDFQKAQKSNDPKVKAAMVGGPSGMSDAAARIAKDLGINLDGSKPKKPDGPMIGGPSSFAAAAARSQKSVVPQTLPSGGPSGFSTAAAQTPKPTYSGQFLADHQSTYSGQFLADHPSGGVHIKVHKPKADPIKVSPKKKSKAPVVKAKPVKKVINDKQDDGYQHSIARVGQRVNS